MMNQKRHFESNAYTAWEAWYLTDYEQRMKALTALKQLFPSQLRPTFDYQLMHSGNIVAKPQFMNSPTGETNELYTQGRGVSLLLIDSTEANALKAVTAILASLLITGNSVIVCSDNLAVTNLLKPLIACSAMPTALLQLKPKASYSEILTMDIRNCVYIGDLQAVASLNQMLAARQHAITALVAETDLLALPNAKDPMLALRFITERVRTINITAIGGNAMLLELGSDKH